MTTVCPVAFELSGRAVTVCCCRPTSAVWIDCSTSLTLEREDMFGNIHSANTSHEDTRHSVWRRIPFKELDTY